MLTANSPSLYQAYADRVAPAPWSQANELSVVRDANGVVVSFSQNAPRIVACVNFVHEIRNATFTGSNPAFEAAFDWRERAQEILKP